MVNVETAINNANGTVTYTFPAAPTTNQYRIVLLGSVAPPGNIIGYYFALIGNGVDTTITVTQATHGLAVNGAMLVQVFEASNGKLTISDVTVNNANGTVSIVFPVAPTTDQYRLVIIG